MLGRINYLTAPDRNHLPRPRIQLRRPRIFHTPHAHLGEMLHSLAHAGDPGTNRLPPAGLFRGYSSTLRAETELSLR